MADKRDRSDEEISSRSSLKSSSKRKKTEHAPPPPPPPFVPSPPPKPPQNRKVHKVGRYNEPCTAAGIIYYTIVDNEVYFMLQHNITKHRYEDFGGKAEHKDKTAYGTAVREAVEETNASIFTGITKSKVSFEKKKNTEIWRHHQNFNKYRKLCYSQYIPESKYMLYITYLPPRLAKHLTPNRFGTKEFEEDVRRNIVGFTKKRLIKVIEERRCNPRLYYLPNLLRRIK